MSNRAVFPLVVLMLPFAWGGIGYVVLNTSPDDLTSRVLFFALLFLALFATLTLAAYMLSFRLFTSKFYRGNVNRSLEQGGLWASFVLVAAVLQATRTLSWASAVLLIGSLAVAQFALLVRK